jgi:hypothetical protein
MCADSVGRALLAMAVPPTQRRGDILRRVPVLGRHGELPEEIRRTVLAARAVEDAVPLDQIDDIDAEAVAGWIVDQYSAATWPAVVLGSPHGAAVQLAAVCGAAWLPTGFTVTVPWPRGSAGNWVAAMAWGTRLAERILARNPAVTVRQVHDPVLRGSLCGAAVSLQIRWRTLPAAYREFLRSRLESGGASLMVRDLRTWPVLDGPPGYGFQIGSPTSGCTFDDYSTDRRAFRKLLGSIGARDWPDLSWGNSLKYGETAGEPSIEPELRHIATETGSAAHRVLYRDPHSFSGAVADLHRAWLGPSASGRHAVVGSGRMIDPWQAVSRGLVPYWCESSSRSAADAAELWFAGSRPFESISVLPDPPGTLHDGTASLRQWRSIAALGRREGKVDALVADRYPLLPPAAGQVTRHLRNVAAVPVRPGPLPVDQAVRGLASAGAATGLLVV